MKVLSSLPAKHSTASPSGIPPKNPPRRNGVILQELSRRRTPSSTAVLLIASFGAFLAFLDSTIVNIAFPDIQKSFPSYDLGSLSWILNAYNIVFAAFLVASGRLADLLGRRRTFVFGVSVFTIASILCAIASNVEQLVAFRVLQGIGSAVLVPASLALVIEAFEPARRGLAAGLWGAAAAFATGLGPPIGGMLVELASWRWVFLVNLPLGIIAVIAAKRGLVESRASGRRRMPDLRGAMLLGVALGLLALGLVKGPEWGWTTVSTLGTFVASTAALFGFVLSSRSHPAPLVEPAMLRVRSFVAGNALTLVAATGFYCYALTHVLYLNYIWGYSLFKAGLSIAPAAFVAAVASAVLGRVADKHGHRTIITFGALIWAGSLLWYIERVDLVPNFLGAWLPGQLLQGVGVGATLPMLSSAALFGVAKGGSYGTTSAVVSTTRQFGAVIGVAALVILMGKPAHGAAAADALRRGWVLAVVCFVIVAVAAVLLGNTRSKPDQEIESEAPLLPRLANPPIQRPATPAVEALSTDDGDLLANLPLFRGLDADTLDELAQRVEEVELEAGAYLFHKGDPSDSLYVLRRGRLEVIQDGIVLRELGRGEVLGELGLLVDEVRSASVRAVRDSDLVRLTQSQFDEIADRGVFASLVKVLGNRLRQLPPPATSRKTAAQVVVSVIGVSREAPVQAVATALVSALSTRLRVADPGRVNRDGLERAERSADKVVLSASIDDAQWRDFCIRVADRIVLVIEDPSPQAANLPARAEGADLVLTGQTPSREQWRQWEELLTPRSSHVAAVGSMLDDMRPLAARIAGRSIGLVFGGGGARGFAHLGVLDELEHAGIHVDRFAGTSMGAIIGGLASKGLDAAAVDAYAYEYFVRLNPFNDYTIPTKGLLRGRRTLALMQQAIGDQLVEELPKEFRCVSVDLISRQAVVHRRGRLVDVANCSARMPGLFPPYFYNDQLHVDGGVLNNLPVSALARSEGPLIAVNVSPGESAPGLATPGGDVPKIPGIGDTLMRTMTLGSQRETDSALGMADVVIRPDTRAVGFLEFHQIDAAREAGRVATREALPQIIEILNR